MIGLATCTTTQNQMNKNTLEEILQVITERFYTERISKYSDELAILESREPSLQEVSDHSFKALEAALKKSKGLKEGIDAEVAFPDRRGSERECAAYTFHHARM